MALRKEDKFSDSNELDERDEFLRETSEINLIQENIELIKVLSACIGIVLAVFGILGFVPELIQYPSMMDYGSELPSLFSPKFHGLLFGIFAENVIKNVVYILIGSAGVFASKDAENSKGYFRILAICFAVFTLIGLVKPASDVFGYFPLYGHNIWFHGVIAAASSYLGFLLNTGSMLSTPKRYY